MEIIYLVIALAVCVSVHEASHALVAHLLGDDTAKIEGRLTLNPLKHLDLFGTLMIVIAHFGWGKPVPFNPNNLERPKRDSALIALAGPISNFLTAALIMILIKYVTMPSVVYGAMIYILELSVLLGVFNLIPIPPLDGSKFIGVLVPKSKEAWYQNFLMKGHVYIIVLVLADMIIGETIGYSPLWRYFIGPVSEAVKVALYLMT